MLFSLDQLKQHDLLNESDPDLVATLNDETFYPFIRVNIMTRLQALLFDQPVKLQDGSNDTFHTLSENCRACRIDFGKILDAEIERRIRHSFLMEHSTLMKAILTHQTELGLTPLHVITLYFAQRLFGLLQNCAYTFNGKADSICAIENDLERQSHLPFAELHVAMLRRTLLLLQEDIEKDNLHVEQPGTPGIYKKIVDEIAQADHTAQEEKGEARQFIWKNAWGNVLALVEKEKPAVEDAVRFDRQQRTKRPCASLLFNPDHARTTSHGTLQFLKGIEAVGPVLDFEKTHGKKLQRM